MIRYLTRFRVTEMEKVNIQEAKTHLSRFAKKVKSGETVILCERNKPIAEIRPIHSETTYPELHPKRFVIREAMNTPTEPNHAESPHTCLIQDHHLMERLNREATRSGIPLEQVAKEAIQIGLSHLLTPPPAKPYRTQPKPMGLKKPYSYDNIGELLAQADGEDYK